MDSILITSEEQAFALLEKLVNGYTFDEGFDLRFEGWPRFVITIAGEDFDGTIPTRIMPTLLELQKQVHRNYALTTFGDDNLRKLKKEDKEKLELLVRAERGNSTWFETLLNDVLLKTVQDALTKMTPEQITIISIVFGLSATSLWGWRLWLSHRARVRQIEHEDKDLDHRLDLSRLDKEKLEILARAVAQVPQARQAAESMDSVRNELLSHLKPTDRLEVKPQTPDDSVQPVQIGGEEARLLVRTPREEPREEVIEDEFLLIRADFSKPGVVRVELQRQSDSYNFRADVPAGALTNDQELALRERSWKRQTVVLRLFVREYNGRYSTAKVTSVVEFKDTEDGSVDKGPSSSSFPVK
jgi:hypothetical protein